MDTPGEIFVIPFKFNFCNGSRSFVNYASSETFMEALKACCRRLKAQDNQDRNLDLSKRGKPPQPDQNKGIPSPRMSKPFSEPRTSKPFRKSNLKLPSQTGIQPKNGTEFFYHSLMLKVIQIPALFVDSSEFSVKSHEGTFLILIYEKTVTERTPKRRPFKPKDGESMKERQKRQLNLKKQAEEENIDRWRRYALRDSKMRRFTNYWLAMFDIKHLKPFTQLIKDDQFKELKLEVMNQIDTYLKEHEKGGRGGRIEEQFHKMSDNTSWLGTELETEICSEDINSGNSKVSKKKPKLNKAMIQLAKVNKLAPEFKLQQSTINEEQQLKWTSAFYFNKDSPAAWKAKQQKACGIVDHPDQDRDIVPLTGLQEPHVGMSKAHELSFQQHARVAKINKVEFKRVCNMQGLALNDGDDSSLSVIPIGPDLIVDSVSQSSELDKNCSDHDQYLPDLRPVNKQDDGSLKIHYAKAKNNFLRHPNSNLNERRTSQEKPQSIPNLELLQVNPDFINEEELDELEDIMMSSHRLFKRGHALKIQHRYESLKLDYQSFSAQKSLKTGIFADDDTISLNAYADLHSARQEETSRVLISGRTQQQT